MNDHDALLAAIHANPGEDTPRLALADWLEEYGGDEGRHRAGFIRSKYPPAVVDCRKRRKADARPWANYSKSLFRGAVPRDWYPWLIPSPGTRAWNLSGGRWRSWPDRCLWSFRGTRFPLVFALRHGFASWVALHPGMFFERAGEIFKTQPVEEVCLLRWEPAFDRYGGWRWFEGRITASLFRLLDGGEMFFSNGHRFDFVRWRQYASRDEAFAALSRACVKYGRERALLLA